MENRNRTSIITIILLIIIILILVMALFMTNANRANLNEGLSNELNTSQNNDIITNSNEINSIDTNKNGTEIVDNVAVNEVKNITTRTYRFFGYDYNTSPDMYSTLKLNSDNTFNFYVNNGEGLTNLKGTYTEANQQIVAKVSNSGAFYGRNITEIIFTKIDGGNELNFDLQLGVMNSNVGSFKLEDNLLGIEDTNKNSSIITRTYRFFGYDYNTSPDMYSTLKLNSDNTFDFYVNNGEGITNLKGTYTENSQQIVAKVSNSGAFYGRNITEILFTKIDGGNELDFDLQLGVMNSNVGSFKLEDNVLNK